MKCGDFELSVVVADRPLPEWRDSQADTPWVAATQGSEFALLLRNGTGGRVLAVPSIDGLSVIDGRPAGYGSPGYVLRPHAQLVVPGWRLDEGSVARFQFGTAAEGYATRMGHSPRNVGVIAAAFFAERRRPEATPPATLYAKPAKTWHDGGGRPHAESDTDDIAVTFGARKSHGVVVRPFERAGSDPAAVISIRYDTRRGLAGRGIGCPAPPDWDAGPAAAAGRTPTSRSDPDWESRRLWGGGGGGRRSDPASGRTQALDMRGRSVPADRGGTNAVSDYQESGRQAAVWGRRTLLFLFANGAVSWAGYLLHCVPLFVIPAVLVLPGLFTGFWMAEVWQACARHGVAADGKGPWERSRAVWSLDRKARVATRDAVATWVLIPLGLLLFAWVVLAT